MPVIIAFCGIDGAGKTSLVARVQALLQLQRRQARIASFKNHITTCRELLARRISFLSSTDYLDGASATWYALASALDFSASVESLDFHGYDLIFMDRWTDCFRAFAATVSPPCTELVETLLHPVPHADLTIFVSVPPTVAWQRILQRERGCSPDESLPLLERFDQAYRSLFAGRSDVPKIENVFDIDASAQHVIQELSKFPL